MAELNGFLLVWELCRSRLLQSYEDLTPNQLNFRLHPAGNSIGEILYHTAGVEHYYGHRMNGTDPHQSEWEARLDNSVIDKIINPGDFPFEEADMTVEKIKKAFAHGESIVKPMLESPTEAQLNSRIQSALGPEIDGVGALQRLAQHPFYHCGQIWQMRLHPSFPEN